MLLKNLRRLLVFLPQYLPGLSIDEMRPHACRTSYALVLVVTWRFVLIVQLALDVLRGNGTLEKKRNAHPRDDRRFLMA